MASRHRDEFEFTREDVEQLENALKNDEFKKLLIEYCEEVQSPESQKTYQKEFKELERERGYLVTFVNPSPGYVVKTSVNGEKKAFINICTSDELNGPSYSRSGLQELHWNLPYSLAPPHDNYDKKQKRCIVYDVVFHPNTLHLAFKNLHFKKMLTETACEAVETNHKVKLDRKNLKHPKLSYKGPVVPAIIRKPDPNHKETPDKEPTLLDELYPQKCYFSNENVNTKIEQTFNNDQESDYTSPKYVIKQRRDIDIKEFTYEKDAKQYSAIPSSIVVEVNLPLLSTTSDVLLDVENKMFSLISEKPARYKLQLHLPYSVNSENGSAKFDLNKRMLIVNLPVVPEKIDLPWRLREDSGVESDTNSPFNSDEDNSGAISLITELSDSPGIEVISESEAYRTSEDKTFFDSSLSYVLPNYMCNVFNNIIVLTLDVKNVISESLNIENNPGDNVKVKFSSIGTGFFPIYYGLVLKIPDGTEYVEPVCEVWDNNVVLQIEITKTQLIDHIFIGLDGPLVKQNLDVFIKYLNDEKCDFTVSGVNNDDIVPSKKSNDNDFLIRDLVYFVPNYTVNVLDDVVAFTFHIENIINESFVYQYLMNNNGMRIKFSIFKSNKLKNNYTMFLKFDNGVKCDDVTFDVMSNNAVMRFKIENGLPLNRYYVGFDEDDLKEEFIDFLDENLCLSNSENNSLITDVEIVTKGNNEINISLRRSEEVFFENNDDENLKAKSIPKHREYDNGICSSSGSFKSILKYRNNHYGRSLSESNVDYMDYNISPLYSLSSADCIPEESSSLKKTVRFSNVITKQTFRTNSSILGQKSKNQRKKRNKKRAQERRLSEGDPSESELYSLDTDNNDDVFIKNFDDLQLTDDHRDSGVADTDDGDSDKGESDKAEETKIHIKNYKNKRHNSQKHKNKGKYQDINFKNDLIFDLDM